MKKRITLSLLAVALLAGCSTQASRLADCEAQGVSKDACYIVEQNRQISLQNAAESQALHNAVAQYGQSAKKTNKRITHITCVNKALWNKLTHKIASLGEGSSKGNANV